MSDDATPNFSDLLELDLPVNPPNPDRVAAAPAPRPTMASIIAEIRAGVTEAVHRAHVETLRVKYGCTTKMLRDLALPGPLGAPDGPDAPNQLNSAQRTAARHATRIEIIRPAPVAARIAAAAEEAAFHRGVDGVAEARRDAERMANAHAVASSPTSIPLTGAAARIAAAASGAVTPDQARAAGRAANLGSFVAPVATPVAVAPTVEAPRVSRATVGRDMIAGAAAGEHGRLFSWQGRGRLARRDLLAALSEAQLPIDWAPRTKSGVAHLGRAVGLVALKAQLVARAIRKRVPAGAASAVYGRRSPSWDSRWQLGTISGEDVGQDYGKIELTVTLRGEELEIEAGNRGDLAMQIRENFAQLRADETYDAGDVTSWLHGILIRHCGAGALGVCYWVPPGGWQTFERLAAALKGRGWGAQWMAPGIPVATTAELSSGLVAGLRAELRDLAALVGAAAASSSCAGQLDAAEVISDRAKALRGVLGETGYAEVLASVRALVAAIRARHTDIELRASMLELV